MKKFIFFSLLALVIASCNSNNPVQNNNNNSGVQIDYLRAKNIANYINQIRSNPNSYSTHMGYDLSYVSKRPALVWNEVVAKVAEAKAKDMIVRKYLAHVDTDGNGINILLHNAGYELESYIYADKSANNFESLVAGGTSYTEDVDLLIKDDGYEPKEEKGHRNHLLGIGTWFDGMVDIGIGVAIDPKSEYITYVSVLITRHK